MKIRITNDGNEQDIADVFEMLKAAEEEAKKRGCKYSFVDTFSFQAPAFYVKHGYKEVFALKEYPITGARYYYTKEL